MPRPVILVVRATIAREHEVSFNRWYEEEHIPWILTLPGVRAARRYRSLPAHPGELAAEDRWQYMTVYEFDSEPAYRAFMGSDHPAALVREYDARFAAVSERVRHAYQQVWP